ncbi:hypothetical protein D6C87_07267 [Aureobasidium pullulans]|nr:hypothetical protein D6C87_07267 [Aureobasidium pullulans]
MLCGERCIKTQMSYAKQWDKLIIRPLTSFFAKLQDVSPTTSAVLIIDALDECSNENDIKGIIRTMARQQLPHAKLRIIITSRPETLVRLEFSDKRNILHSSLSLDDVPQHVIDADLARFLHSRFDAIRDHQEGLTEDWPGLHTLNILLRRCGGLFIYAETLCLYLEEDCQHSQSRLQAVLNKTTLQLESHTTALDDMYLTVLTNAFKNLSNLSEREKDRSNNLYDHVIGSIVVLQEDLSASTLSCLTQVSQFDIMAILHRLRSVIKQSGIESPITLLHETFREFVSDGQRCTKDHLAVNTKTAHRRTFKYCLHVLSVHLKQDLCDLKDPGVARDDPRVDSVKILDGLPLHVQYAVCHWNIHLERGGIDTTNHCAVDTFLHKHLLHWVEAMSWLNKYAEAVESISRLYELLVIYDKTRFQKMTNEEQEFGTDLKLFCWDARKFMISNGSVIAKNPLQIYRSALIFSPKNSLICRAFSEQRLTWLLRYRSPCEQWDQCILKVSMSTLAHELPLPIAFSPDSSYIAIISENCAEIWSIKSGIPIASLPGTCDTEHLLFSPDGKHLALMLDIASIGLYDTVAIKLDHVLQTLGLKIEKFLFSPNGFFLVSISEDQVDVWAVAEAELYWTLTTRELHYTLAELAKDPGPGRREAVHFDAHMLEISDDSSLIAIVSSDNIVRLWNLETKSLRFQIPLGSFDNSTTLGFSANHDLIFVKGTKVISWNSRSNRMHTTTISIGSPGCSRVLDPRSTHWLSPNRSVIATLKDSCHVFICNTTTGACCKKLSFESSINWLCFSPDSTCFSLQSKDQVILYDIMSIDRIGTFPIHPSTSRAGFFSPDGSMLAHLGTPTRIWDISILPCEAKHEKEDLKSQIRLPVDGRLVVCCRQKNKEPSEIYLLDVLCDLSTTIECPFLIGNYSISPDKNKMVAHAAANSDEGWAYLYNLADKTSLRIDSVRASAFSNSSQMLAIAGLDFRVRIWDLPSRECRTTLVGHSCPIDALTFSPNDQKLATLDIIGRTMIWHCQSGSLEADSSEHHWESADDWFPHEVEMAFSTDESMFAYTWCDEERNWGCLWGLETNTLLKMFHVTNNGWRQRALSFSDDGRHLRTFFETIDLLPSASPSLDMGQPLDFTNADGWIRWHGTKILRPPDDWAFAKHDSWGNKLAMVNRKGEVAFIEFDPQELRKALGI